jgi:hypothetical protein
MRNARIFMNDGLGRMWQDCMVACFEVLSQHMMDGLGSTTGNMSQCRVLNSNPMARIPILVLKSWTSNILGLSTSFTLVWCKSPRHKHSCVHRRLLYSQRYESRQCFTVPFGCPAISLSSSQDEFHNILISCLKVLSLLY